MTDLTKVIKKVGGLTLTTMRKYTLWIKPGSFYHLRIYQLKELKKCPHLMNLDPPKPDLEAPRMTSLRTHETTFEAARKNPQITQEAFEKARDKYADALKLHGCHATSTTVRAMAPPRGLPTTGSGDAPPSGSGPVRSQRESSSSEATSHMKEEDDPDQTTLMEVYPSHTGKPLDALGVIGWMTKRRGDSRAPGAINEDEAPQSTRVMLELRLPSSSVMRRE